MRAAIRLLSSVCFLLPPTVAMADEPAARAVIENRCLVYRFSKTYTDYSAPNASNFFHR
jgi:hypothetical protein